jgi:NADP-dependent 3-hydroxy acid dehydrogenase YdfG
MKKIALITGATAGIGEAVAEKFAQNGYGLILTGRRKELLDKTSHRLNDKYGVEVLPCCFDVRNANEVEQHLGNLPADWQAVDVLVNNAGLAVGLNSLQEGLIDDWERMIDTNIKGLLYVTRTIAPLMIKRQQGHIFNIGSIAGKEVYVNGNVYCATKHAVDALSKAMRMDMLPHNIRVTQICPGAAETEFSIVRFKGDEQRAGDVYKGFEPLHAEDIADVVYFVATLPVHVNINDLVIMPTAQASISVWNKKL